MNKIAVDMGSGLTKIYMPGCGVVLVEATCIAVEEYKEGGEKKIAVKAYGDKARALSGRAALNTRIVNPVCEGDIVSEELAVWLFEYFLEKIEINHKKAKRTEVVFILPCGVKSDVRLKYLRLAQSCGIPTVYFTLTPFAAVLGHNLAISESMPMFSLDIGHSMANIAAFSQDGIIYGLSVSVGGGHIDTAIIDEVADRFNLRIGTLTSERIKNSVGSLLPDDNKMTIADGRDLDTGVPTSVAVYSGEIYDVITSYIDKILEYVAIVLSKLPAEVASSVMRGGIYVSGGLFKMDGLIEYVEEKLGIPVNVPEEVQLAQVIGGGTILASDILLEKFSTEEE
ncbi:MAG: rod shape-determining protein [Clostridiales bacterium]|nr:rod shape-determining protein [Clostridiales bacterium]